MQFLLSLLPLLLIAGVARADQINLLPSNSAVELRSYGFGLIPLDGNFTRFHGQLLYDPANPHACEVVLDIEAASLATSMRDQITGPDMMDVARFPDLKFHGACQGEAVVGDLLMHGQTHPVSLNFVRSSGKIVATGELHRAEWGITGMPLIGGAMIRIRVTVPDPATGTHT